MIAYGHRYASKLSASALGIGLLLIGVTVHAAEKTAPAASALTNVNDTSASAADAADQMTIAFDDAGVDRSVVTSTKTVGEFLQAAGVTLEDGDFLSSAAADPLSDGMRLTYRPAVSIVLHQGKRIRTVRSSDLTVSELLSSEHVVLAPTDVVQPAGPTRLSEGAVIRVSRIAAWTRNERTKIVPHEQKRFDSRLARGTRKTLKPGVTGIRETTISFYVRDGENATKTVVSSHVVRSAQPRVIVVGTGPALALRTFAQDRLSGAVRFAGQALHVLATAYTASCYGCSGITASGVHAGHGVIAVDPRFIPLGTRFFIPGYGRAIAGDTGGAIVGHRVDLGFNALAEAREFGRRPIVMYIVH